MTTLQLHEVYVLERVDKEKIRGILAVHEDYNEAMEHATMIEKNYGAIIKIEKANFFGALPK